VKLFNLILFIMTELEELYNAMLVNLEKGIADLEKFEEGNMSAGTRVRKNMQDVKELAQKVRLEVQEQKNSKKVTA
tara:strand:- start:1443 stop:1670 length:228 start_codon:yes stop_codon:yes gene_type:complete